MELMHGAGLLRRFRMRDISSNANAVAYPTRTQGALKMNRPVVLITGALTGIGRATALAFAREGHRVVVSGRRDEAGNALAAELRELGAEAEYMHADVRNEAEIRQVVEQTVARFGRL